jgi:hypothetical protein
MKTVVGCIMVLMTRGLTQMSGWPRLWLFLDRTFSLSKTNKVRCPCSKCQNIWCLDNDTISLDLCRNGFMPHYVVWVFHGESATQARIWGKFLCCPFRICIIDKQFDNNNGLIWYCRKEFVWVIPNIWSPRELCSTRMQWSLSEKQYQMTEFKQQINAWRCLQGRI